MDRLCVWDTLADIGTPFRVLMLGPMPFAWMRCPARTALVISAAPHVPQRTLLLVWSVKALPAFNTRHVFLVRVRSSSQRRRCRARCLRFASLSKPASSGDLFDYSRTPNRYWSSALSCLVLVLVQLMIAQLLRLNPFSILTPIIRVQFFIAVRKHDIFLDVRFIRESAGAIPFSLGTGANVLLASICHDVLTSFVSELSCRLLRFVPQ